MKHIKLIANINLILMILTPLGYLAIYPGIILHVTLGIFQVLIFGFLLLKQKELSPFIQKLLISYVISLACIIVITLFDDDNLMLIAWSGSYILAILFTVILVNIKNNQKSTS